LLSEFYLDIPVRGDFAFESPICDPAFARGEVDRQHFFWMKTKEELDEERRNFVVAQSHSENDHSSTSAEERRNFAFAPGATPSAPASTGRAPTAFAENESFLTIEELLQLQQVSRTYSIICDELVHADANTRILRNICNNATDHVANTSSNCSNGGEKEDDVPEEDQSAKVSMTFPIQMRKHVEEEDQGSDSISTALEENESFLTTEELLQLQQVSRSYSTICDEFVNADVDTRILRNYGNNTRDRVANTSMIFSNACEEEQDDDVEDEVQEEDPFAKVSMIDPTQMRKHMEDESQRDTNDEEVHEEEEAEEQDDKVAATKFLMGKARKP
jgi:hypothetical protein